MNTDQLWVLLRTLLSATGPIAALLIARGMPAEDVGLWSSLALALLAFGPIVSQGVIGLMSKTDKSKLAAVNAMPDVVQVVVKDSAGTGATAAVKDKALEKVVPQSSST